MVLESTNFTGHLLIAMPSMTDPYFAKSVTLICSHSADGAMGVVINRPTDMTYSNLFDKVGLSLNNEDLAERPVLFGGPVQPERGFVIHSLGGEWDSSIQISEHVRLTTSKDILSAVAESNCAQQLLLSLGYAGWVAGQLEQEIAENAWLSVKPKDQETLIKLLFETPHEDQLNAAMGLLGFDPSMLSDTAGHA
jgi:putative transcriptional regulator